MSSNPLWPIPIYTMYYSVLRYMQTIVNFIIEPRDDTGSQSSYETSSGGTAWRLDDSGRVKRQEVT